MLWRSRVGLRERGALTVNGTAGAAETTFPVLYEKWGVKNPSTFLLRVSDKVEINVRAVGRLSAAAQTSGGH